MIEGRECSLREPDAVTAYLIVEIAAVLDEEAYATYRSLATPTVEAHAGRYLVRGGEPVALWGSWSPFRFILASFDQPDGPRGWWSSDDYRDLKAARQKATVSNMVAIAGEASPQEAVDGGIGAVIILDVRSIRDERQFSVFRESVEETILARGGGYLARGGTVEVLEGDWVPGRLVVVAFPSMELARDWWSAPGQAGLIARLQASTEVNVVLARGLAEGV